jgi:6-phosphogluconolactonase (cycloisomerase 2 family)
MGVLKASSLLLGLAAGIGRATNLYVSSYSGDITSLSLTSENGAYDLKAVYTNDGCSTSPSWLELDQARGYLYCSDEGLSTPNGTLSSYSVAKDGKLTQIQKADVISGPVSSVIYGDRLGQRAIALAH